MNSLTYAYIGDSVYDLYIKEMLIKSGLRKVNDLQKEAIKLVNAVGQARILKELMEKEFFNTLELGVIMTARNTKSKSKAKNADILTYKHATALEAVIGYLYIEKDKNRLSEVMERIWEMR